MRIHVGQISPALAANISDLKSRLEKFGSLSSPLSLHRKEFGDYYFAFVDMELDQQQYNALSKSLNGLIFKQSKLIVNEARQSYPVLMEAQTAAKPEPKLNLQQNKRYLSRQPREVNVLKGRHREGKLRNEPTFRVKIKDEIRKPKMRKRKLWGIEKRPLAKLVSEFVNGEWRDSESKAVEIVSTLHDEHAQAERIAQTYADNVGFLSDSDFDDFKENAKIISDVDSDNDIEIVSREANNIIDAPTEETDKESNETEESEENSIGIPEIQTSKTENLRSALSSETPFTLFGEPSVSEPEPELFHDAPSIVTLNPPKVGLFFSHRSSPYLRSQSQIAKMVAQFDASVWEKEFFDQRGEYNRNLRKRRRESLRMARRMGKKRGE